MARERSSKLIEFLKWSGAIAGGAAIGAVTVHYVGKALRDKEEQRSLPAGGDDGLDDSGGELQQATANPVAMAPMAVMPVLPTMVTGVMAAPGPMGAMPQAGALGPSAELMNLRSQLQARDAQRAREKAQRDKDLADTIRRFEEDE